MTEGRNSVYPGPQDPRHPICVAPRLPLLAPAATLVLIALRERKRGFGRPQALNTPTLVPALPALAHKNVTVAVSGGGGVRIGILWPLARS